MGRDCRVCISPNRTKIDDLRTKGLEVKKIWRIIQIEYKEDIPIHSLHYHFRNHLENIIQEGIKASRFREEQINKHISQGIEAARVLMTNLEKCAEQYKLLGERIDDPEVRREIRDIMSRSNQTIELILRFLEKVESKPVDKGEDVLQKIIHCMQDFPRDLIVKFSERWDNYGR